MASAVQQRRALPPTATRVGQVSHLSHRNSTSASDESLPGTELLGKLPGCSLLVGGTGPNLPNTPCSSSSDPGPDQRSSRDNINGAVDPVVLLTRPVEGFHHPRQHFFTDRLVGRFFEDSSLDAETRKTNKGLAGRLGTATTAGSSSSTRPGTSTSGAATPHIQSHSYSVSAGDSFGSGRGSRRIQKSSSASSLGNGGVRSSCRGHSPVTTRTQRVGGGGGGTGLSTRKEQVEREIMEQKALIEKLEGRMASLSSLRGHRAGADIVGKKRCVGVGDQTIDRVCRPVEPTLESHFGRPSGEELEVGDGQKEVVKIQSLVRGQQARSRRRRKRGEDLHPQTPAGATETDVQATTIQTTCRQEQRKSDGAIEIKRDSEHDTNSISLQSARDDLERHLKSISSLLDSLAVETSGERSRWDSPSRGKSENVAGRVSSSQREAMAVVAKFLETNQEDGLAKPPFELLRSMYGLLGELRQTLSLLVTAVDETGHAEEGLRTVCSSLMESFAGAQIVIGEIRDAVGAGDNELLTAGLLLVASSAPTIHTHRLPAGSGRAVAVAAASGKGGILVSPRERESTSQPTFHGNALVLDKVPPAHAAQEKDRVKLNTLSVGDVGRLLRSEGFLGEAARFISQSVDGAMLSDPNLCETDFLELGLGQTVGESGGVSDDGTSIARLLAFFRACQTDGVAELISTVEHDDDDCEIDRGPDREGFGSIPGAEAIGPGMEGMEPKGALATKASDASCGELWSRSSMDLNRENQTIVADVSLDTVEDVEDDTATPPLARPTSGGTVVTGGGRRISVKCNSGVVVTVGGLEPALVSNIDDLGNTEVNGGSADVERRESSATSRTCRSLGNNAGRRGTIGLTAVILDAEDDTSVTENRRLSQGPREGLPPEMVVMTGNETIDIFR